MKEKLVMVTGMALLAVLAIPIGILILLATVIWNGMDWLFRMWERKSGGETDEWEMDFLVVALW